MMIFTAQAFPFVHPGLAGIALATGLIPILVHLINRRRHVRVRWAAMSFLLAAHRRSARRVRLEQWLLLLARIGVIVLLGLAVARPYLPASSILPLRSSRVHRVLLLDNSLSMKARTGDGRSRFELAKACAEKLLESFSRTDAVSIVTLSYPAEAVVAQAAYDRRFVRERLAAIEASERGTDTVGAVSRTLEILKTSQVAEGNRAVYLISDFPRDAWEEIAPDNPTAAVHAIRRLADALADPAVDLTLVGVAPDAAENIALTRIATESPLIGVSLPARIMVQVTNHGLSSVHDATLRVRRDNEIIRREPLPRLAPGTSTAVVITTVFSTPGTHLIEAKVSASNLDALADDDARYLSIEVRHTTPVLLVDGRAGASRLAGQAGYLATALAPNVMSAPSTLLEPKVITEPELAGEALADYDVVVLCNIQRLPADTWKRLEVFAGGGGGLMIFGGDLVSTDNYNRYGYAEGAGLIPGRVGRPVAMPPDPATSNSFKLDRLTHPIVAEFHGVAESGLFTARVEQYLPIEIDPRRGEVVLEYTNGEAALVASAFGAGRVLLCTTTANMDWTNLPAKGDYVSLMLNAMAYLSPRHGEHRNVLVGQTFRERLTPAQSSLPLGIISSGPATSQPSLVPDGEALALEYGPIEHAGAVVVSIGAETRTVAANVDPAESELVAADEHELRRAVDRPLRLASAATVVAEEPVSARSTELASLVLYLVVGLLFAEMWMAVWLGSQRTYRRDHAVGTA